MIRVQTRQQIALPVACAVNARARPDRREEVAGSGPLSRLMQPIVPELLSPPNPATKPACMLLAAVARHPPAP